MNNFLIHNYTRGGILKKLDFKNMQLLREKKNIKQVKLSMMVGVSQQSITYYETNTRVPSLPVAIRLAKALDIYYKMQNDMINNYNLREKNYSTLQNLNEISAENEILKTIKNINEIQSLKNKIFNMIDLSDKINLENEGILAL